MGNDSFGYFIKAPKVANESLNPPTTPFLDSVNISAVAIMITVSIKMAQTTLISWREITILIISAIISLKFKKLNTMWLIPIGSILGYFLFLI